MTAQPAAVRASASQKVAVSVALTLMASTGGPLSASTLGKDGKFHYNVASVPLIAEAVKLLMSVVCMTISASAAVANASGRSNQGKAGSPPGNKTDDGDSADTETSACLRDDEKPLGSKPPQTAGKSSLVGGKAHGESRGGGGGPGGCSGCGGGGGSTENLAAIAHYLREELRQITWRSALIYFPPSMLFIVINNLRIWNMRYIDPASAELLGTLRIALTAVMLWGFLQRSFTRTQWASVALLSLSVALSQMDGVSLKLVGDPRGFMGAAVVASCSALASVYMEWALKGSFSTSMHTQNAQIYGWGVLLNGIVYVATSPRSAEGAAPRSLTDGYTPLTWLLVGHLACSGLIVAWLLKYSDSITKIQATSVSLFLTAVISAAWLGTVISFNMVAGMILIASSLFMYHGLFFPQLIWRTSP